MSVVDLRGWALGQLSTLLGVPRAQLDAETLGAPTQEVVRLLHNSREVHRLHRWWIDHHTPVPDLG